MGIDFETAWSSFPTPSLILDSELGVLACNEASLSLLHTTSEQLKDKPLQDTGVFDDETLSRISQVYSDFQQSDEWTATVNARLTPAGHTPFDMKLTVTRLSHEAGKATILLTLRTDIPAAEDFYRLLSDQNFIGVGVLQDNKAVYVNDAIIKMTGIARNEFYEMDSRDIFKRIIHPDDLELVLQQASKKQSGQSDDAVINYSYRYTDGSGEYKWIEHWSNTISYRGRPAILAVMLDVSQQRALEKELLRNEERLRIAVESMPVLVDAVDGNDVFIVWNKECEKVSGYSADEIIGNPGALKMLYPDEKYREEMLQEWERRKKSEDFRDWELTMTCKDGSQRVVSWSGQSVEHPIPGWDSWNTGVDVTERKRMEAELKASEERYRSLVESAQESIFTVNKENQFTFMNPVAARQFGISPRDVPGKTMYDLFPKELADRQAATIGKVFESELGVVKETVTEIDGELRSYRTSLEPVRDDKGAVVSVLGIARDITDMVKIREELRTERDFVSSILETANSLIVCLDKHGRVTVFNDECERITGHKRDEVIGENWARLFLPKDHPAHKIEDFARWVREHPTDQYEGQLLTKSGEIRTILWSNSALFSENSDELTAFAIGHDITKRKIAEQELAASEKRYSLATSAAKVGVWDWNVKTGDFYLDPSIKAMLGYEDDEIPNDIEVWQKYIYPDDEAAVMKAAQDHINGLTDTYSIEHRMIHKDGSLRWILTRGTCIVDESGTPVRMLGTDTDITERKLAEMAAREEEERFSILMDHIPEASVKGVDLDGSIFYWNDASETMLGYSAEEAIGKNLAALILPSESATEFNRTLERGRSSRTSGKIGDSTETQLIRKDGRVIPVFSIVTAVSLEDKPPLIYRIDVDLTERKKSEEARLASERKYRELTDFLPQTVFEIDTEGHFTFVNIYGYESTGYTPEDVKRGLTAFDLFTPEERLIAIERFKGVLQGLDYSGKEYTFRRKNGSTFPVIIYSDRVVQDGNVTGLRGVVIDISKRKQAELMLQQAYDQLESEKNKLYDKNIALKVLLDQIREEREEVNRQIQANLNRLVYPVIHALKDKTKQKVHMYLDILQKTLEELTSPFTERLEVRFSGLTPREIQICNMIRGGKTSKEIASALDISVLTVHKFRQQIRKKLGIANNKVNLSNHLKAIEFDNRQP